MGQPPIALLRIAVRRGGASDVLPTICRPPVHVHLGLAHGIPHGLDALIGLLTNDHFLSFAGALFDDWLLAPLGDLEYPFLHGRAGITAHSAGCGAPFHNDAVVPGLHLLFHRGLDDISANAITPLGRRFADGQLLLHEHLSQVTIHHTQPIIGETAASWVARINPTEIDGAKRQTVSSLRTLQAATEQQKQQIDESVFRAWVEPKTPRRDPGGLLMKKADTTRSPGFAGRTGTSSTENARQWATSTSYARPGHVTRTGSRPSQMPS